jgi:solute carrier family 25 carnitine/acylcarnitine transporter 20/29
MQMDNIREKKYTGSLHCLSSLTKSFGVPIIYTGHAINTIREATFLMTYFFVYEGFRGMMFETEWINPKDKTDHHREMHKWAIPVAGGLAGSIAWFVSFPLDCVRAGVQGQSVDNSGKWKGSIEVFKELMKTRGIRGLYSGVSPSIMRAFLVSGSRFSAYEAALWLLRGDLDKGDVVD